MNTTFNYVQSAKKYGAITTLILALLVSVGIQAQNTTAAITKQADIDYAAGAITTNGSIKLIDNKGTIKYIQATNGITTLTNTSGADLTTTTFQLGGTLTDDTYIDVNGKVFGLNGIAMIDTTAENASTDATSLSTNAGTGYTLLTRDESTGAIKKLKLSDLGVVGAQEVFTATAGQTNYTLNGDPKLSLFKTYVYRNGAKLVADVDYKLSTTIDGLVELQNTFPVFAGDVIEAHYLN